MNGGIAGDIDALFNRIKLFTGLHKGAVFGGAVAGVSYMIIFLSNAKSTPPADPSVTLVPLNKKLPHDYIVW
ncbi:hypothetical protein AB4Y90_00360 [Chryseobacterium sp. 2TAF14]|uniref:hypothetical protein n=1 Tax=Chryseobacterium sp. 2TAF14 TaxID=3233007 RepID=UPI003F939752